MLYGKRIAVVLPAYNAARTLEKTVQEIPKDIRHGLRQYYRTAEGFNEREAAEGKVRQASEP
jgi:hypothetical protein